MDTKWFTKLYITITREIVTNHLQFCGIWISFLGSCLVMLHLKDLFAAWNTQNKRISVLVLYVTPSSNMYWQKIRKNQQFVINHEVLLGLKTKSHFLIEDKNETHIMINLFVLSTNRLKHFPKCTILLLHCFLH